MLLGFSESKKQAQALANLLAVPYGEINIHHFPDGESKVTIPTGLPAHVIFYRSLDRPNDKLIELLLAAKTAREAGSSRLTLIAPYLCYMRQDTAFIAGEAVSQKIIGELLANIFDDVISVDPHLHRTHNMMTAVPVTHSIAVSAGHAMSDFLRTLTAPLLIGPDAESRQWVENIAQRSGLEYGVGNKIRSGDYEVNISLPDIDLHGRHIILIDDVISSGETMAISAKLCLAAGAQRVDVLITHALFADGAENRLYKAGVKKICSTDSIPHHSNTILLTPILADAITSLL